MKLQIDTTNKVITINEEVNLLEFIDYLKNIPEWEKYIIKGNVEWTPYYIPQSPIIVPLINPYKPVEIYYTTSPNLE